MSTARRSLAALAITIVVVGVAGCSATGHTTGGSSDLAQGAPDQAITSDERATDTPGSVSGKASQGGAGLMAVDELQRSVIRTGSTRLQAQDPRQAAAQAAAAARGLGGLVTGEQTWNAPGNPSLTKSELTLRVPNNRFDDLLHQISGLGDVLSQTQEATDVTGQVADVDARVDAQRASVRRIQALLSRADTIGEVVAIEAQLAQRQADLEALEAQQKALADQTALATLQVSIIGPEPVVADEDQAGFMAGLQAGWKAFTDATQAALTGLGAVLPFVGFVLLLALPVAAWLRSRARREIAPPSPAEPAREDLPVG